MEEMWHEPRYTIAVGGCNSHRAKVSSGTTKSKLWGEYKTIGFWVGAPNLPKSKLCSRSDVPLICSTWIQCCTAGWYTSIEPRGCSTVGTPPRSQQSIDKATSSQKVSQRFPKAYKYTTASDKDRNAKKWEMVQVRHYLSELHRLSFSASTDPNPGAINGAKQYNLLNSCEWLCWWQVQCLHPHGPMIASPLEKTPFCDGCHCWSSNMTCKPPQSEPSLQSLSSKCSTLLKEYRAPCSSCGFQIVLCRKPLPGHGFQRLKQSIQHQRRIQCNEGSRMLP